jgi:hypothetical protein
MRVVVRTGYAGAGDGESDDVVPARPGFRHISRIATIHPGSAVVWQSRLDAEDVHMGLFLLGALGLYAAIGVVTAVAFVSCGVTRALPTPTTVSLGARLLLLPGSVLLWPYILRRWLGSGRRR